MNLHYHRFTVDAAAEARRGRGDAALRAAAARLDRWTAACPAGEPALWEDAWNPYAAATRVLNAWLARRLLLGDRREAARALARRLAGRAAADAAFLADWLEFDLGGNHLLRDAAALAAAGAWFEGPLGRRCRALASDLLERESAVQFLPDGLHDERSPMYHALALEDLVVGGGAALVPPERLARAIAALATVTHPDGDIALFNDAAFGIAAPARRLLEAAAGLGLVALSGRPDDLPEAGYWRPARGPWTVLFDAGRLGPDDLPAHAHCDALSLEASFGGRRIVTDTGVDRYEAGPQRDFQRSVRAHSTLQVGDLDQGEPFGSFRMGRRPSVSGSRLGPHAVAGGHDGFGRRGRHRRTVRIDDDGALRWTDRVASDAPVPVRVRLHLAPGTAIAGATLEVPGGGRFRVLAPPDGAIAIEAGVACERFGSARERPVLCWHGTAGAGRDLEFALLPVG